jgi:hypothetical protein
LDYLEEHLKNVEKAFKEITSKCPNIWFVKNKNVFKILKEEVYNHDISKFSRNEFVNYRKKFYPIEGEKCPEVDWMISLKHHLLSNPHHHEIARTDLDIVHMVIDWTAMGYKFGDNAESYYKKNKKNIRLSKDQKEIMFEIFNCLKGEKQ